MRLKEDAPLVVPDDVGEELVVLAHYGKALRHALFLAPHDIDDGKRQEALRGFLQCGVEDLVHLVAQDHRCRPGRGDPKSSQ